MLPKSKARAAARTAARGAHPKPRGRVPLDATGEPCRWDSTNGGWIDSNSVAHVVEPHPKRRAERVAKVEERLRSTEAERLLLQHATVAPLQRATAAPRKPLPPPPAHPGPGWQWDNEYYCYYNVAQAEFENAWIDAANEESQAYDVQEWLVEQINALISELEPVEPPVYSAYELERQRTVVCNERLLLELSQAALRDAPVGTSSTHLAFLEQECRKAEARVRNAVRHELEIVEHLQTQ